jgi:hypothetical protein
MDDRQHSNCPDSLDARTGSEPAPIVEPRPDDPTRGRRIVTYCFRGRELGEGIAAAFRIMGIEPPLP